MSQQRSQRFNGLVRFNHVLMDLSDRAGMEVKVDEHEGVIPHLPLPDRHRAVARCSLSVIDFISIIL